MRRLVIALLAGGATTAAAEDVSNGEQLAQMQQQMAQILRRVEVLESENTQLRKESSAMRAALAQATSTEKSPRQVVPVSPLGEAGRQLSAATCCRWTKDGTCSASEVTEECTSVHEYLESKTTTHEFAQIDDTNCLGADHTLWRWAFDGVTGNVSLSKDGAGDVASFKTPLKVTHAQNCGSVAPTLTLQMDAVASGSLTVGGLDLATLNPTPDPASASTTCVKIVTVTSTSCDGNLKVWALDPSATQFPGRLVTAGYWGQGKTVVEQCFNNLAAIVISADDDNGWAGTVYYSSDGGATYDQPFLCVAGTGGFCATESTGSSLYTGGGGNYLGVDLDNWASNSMPSAMTQGPVCDGGKFCTFQKPNNNTCFYVDVTNEGFMAVQVVDARSADADDWQDVITLTSTIIGTSVWYKWCFDGFQRIRVSNTDSNGLMMDLTTSTDAGVTFDGFVNCVGCHGAGQPGGVAKITVDGDAGTSGHDTAGMICDAGNWCELTLA